MILSSPSPTSPQGSTYLLKLRVTPNQYTQPTRGHVQKVAEQHNFESLTHMFPAEGDVLPSAPASDCV